MPLHYFAGVPLELRPDTEPDVPAAQRCYILNERGMVQRHLVQKVRATQIDLVLERPDDRLHHLTYVMPRVPNLETDPRGLSNGQVRNPDLSPGRRPVQRGSGARPWDRSR